MNVHLLFHLGISPEVSASTGQYFHQSVAPLDCEVTLCYSSVKCNTAIFYIKHSILGCMYIITI